MDVSLDAGLDRAGHFIDGEWVTCPADESGESFNPATGDLLGRYCLGSAKIADEAVSAARRAFFSTQWSRSPRLRAKVLLAFADRLEAAKDELVALITHENGKLIPDAAAEVMAGANEARFYAGLARVPMGRSMEPAPGSVSILAREAAGVAAIIVPWNAPLTLLVRSLAPALAAGCTVVVKPAPQTTFINRRAIECLVGIPDLPKGVVNSVNEDGSSVGEALVASPDVDVISFTGSSRTGKLIMAAAAPTLKRLSLELGGKSPGIVFPDADLDLATRELVGGGLSIAGQFCMSASRILVQASCYDDMKGRLAEAFSSIRVGPGYLSQSEMGPLIDRPNQKRVGELIQQAADEGELVVRGEPLAGEYAGGAFLTPTLFAIEDPSSPLVCEELFGPIVSLERFEDEDEAVAKAHATRYGLAASIYTRDLNRAHRLSRNLRFGTIWFNSHRRQFAEAEVGGFGESGLGRLHGVEGLYDFLETKHVYLECG